MIHVVPHRPGWSVEFQAIAAVPAVDLIYFAAEAWAFHSHWQAGPGTA